MAIAENTRVIYSDLLEEWHWKAGRHRKSHIRFGEGVLEKYRRKRQLAGSPLYRTHGSEGRRSQQCDLLTRHLLMNLHEMIARWLAGIHGRLRGLPPVPGVEMLPARRRGAYPRTRADAVRTAESRARRVAQYEEVRRRFGAGETLLAISRATGLARTTVRRFAYAESFPERAGRGPVASTLDPFLDHLEARVAAGCENAAALWREVKDLGFPGTAKQVRRWLSRRRSAPAPSGPRRDAAAQPEAASPQLPDATPTLPSPKQLAWLLVQSPETLRAPETATLAWIAQDAEVARASALVPRLAELVRSCGIGRDEAPAEPRSVLTSWLDEAASCGIQALETFTAGLRQDEAPFRPGLTLPGGGGQAGGRFNKSNLFNRRCYGGAKFDLFRRPALLPPCSTRRRLAG